jgi:hypothetical protein
MEEMKNVHKDSKRKPEAKRQLGRPKCGREDNIKYNLNDIGQEVLELDSSGSG